MDQTTHAPKPGLEILKTGTHVSEDGRTFTFTDADLQAIADSYDPELSEAPLVVGHPTLDAPAYGWTRGLRSEGGKLYAEPTQVEAAFAELVNDGRYKKISSSIYLPDTPGNPKPGSLYLKHVGFLGGAAPSIKGLRAAAFSEASGDGPQPMSFSMPLSISGLGWTLTDLFQRVRDWVIDDKGLETADRVIPQWQIRAIDEHTRDRTDNNSPLIYAAPPAATTTETPMTQQQTNAPADFAAREQAITDKATALEQREKAIKDREETARREDAASFAEQLVNDGKLLPRSKTGLIELLVSVPASTALNFAEGGSTVSKPAGEFLRELLDGLPKQLDFSEKSGDETRGGITAANFAAPPGVTVDAAQLAVHQRAVAYQLSNPSTPYLAAVKAVGG